MRANLPRLPPWWGAEVFAGLPLFSLPLSCEEIVSIAIAHDVLLNTFNKLRSEGAQSTSRAIRLAAGRFRLICRRDARARSLARR
eukprot:8996449-Pyramimonas_sp.AAC.1